MTDHIASTTRTCPRCGASHFGTFAELKEHFYVRSEDTRKLYTQCKPCQREHAAKTSNASYHAAPQAWIARTLARRKYLRTLQAAKALERAL